uniref:Helicase n=1 Tax=viral metagenome TaxID=1070528 RepID=A0A6C0AZF3_9ZZZZ
MVKFCRDPYPKKDEGTYSCYFEKYSFPLSSFQKFAIEAIVEGHHSLSCVPTGSGKTMPALFAIDYFTSKGKKVIYTSPIKALSNQKYHEFTQKFPHISIGLLTGDIKNNPEADVLIMTAEILQNTLYRKKQNHSTVGISSSSLLMFDMDFDTELGCVIQDEIHMINDAERGHVWESIILLLPQHIQMVMLSATLDKPEKFAHWIETRGNQTDCNENKQVYLATSNFRHVPLTHYSFITCNNGIFKAVKEKTLEKEIRSTIDTLHIIQSPTGEFQEQNYHKVKKMLTLFEQKQVYVKRSHVLNQVCKYMVENNMLPAVCFILSRKQIEAACKEITVPLLEDDSKVGYIVRKECEQILRSKLPNYQEYLELPEYLEVIRLLEKGIAIHHSGVMPILREIVEILFEKGYIKFLFATETFSVGLNMPIKTAIFTDVKKFDGSVRRMLYPHEYNQASGRAGRRGLDTVGHVIHLSNLFRDIELSEYRTMMQGKPQTLTSKFKISYHLLLNLISIGNQNFVEFCKRSMIQDEIDASLGNLYKQKTDCEKEVDEMNQTMIHNRTPFDVVNRYIDLIEVRATSVNKKRKDAEKEIQAIQNTYKFIDSDKERMLSFHKKCQELEAIQNHFILTDTFLNTSVQLILDKMQIDEFISRNSEGFFELTLSGAIACQLREVHCLVFSELCKTNTFDQFDTKQLIAIFSCFTNITVSDEQKSFKPNSKDKSINAIILDIAKQYEDYQEFESLNNASTGIDYTIHYDLIDYVIEWTECESAMQCKVLLQRLESQKGVFLGEFVKAITKINNISCEVEKVAEMIGNMALLSKLKEIPELTLKFVATNQSLYV